MHSSMRKAALDLAEMRFPVLPIYWPEGGRCACRRSDCSCPAKHPLTKNGVHDATADRERIESWWRRWHQANVAIATGERVVALDVDPRHGGDETLQRLQTEQGPLPDTVTSLTGGGGVHYLFAG